MPTYVQDLEYTIHTVKSVTHQLKVVEEPDIPDLRSKLTISIIRNNSSNISEGGREHLKLTINGETVYNDSYSNSRPPEYSSDEVFVQTYYFTNQGSFTVSATYKCDCVDSIGNFPIHGITPEIYYTVGSATLTKNFTPIDKSSPHISGISVKADRYGMNASASFTASHASYELYRIDFLLSGLTRNQAYYRYNTYYRHYNQGDYADGWDYGLDADGTYWFKLSRGYPIGTSKSICFDLDERYSNSYPLDSGKNYPYTITVTAENNKSKTVTGTLSIPQKVTGITCEPQIELNPNQTADLIYSVFPANAEEQEVTFASSDINVATVDANGVITAISEGPCVITVTTVDGGFVASCSVNILDISVYPLLVPVVDYFTFNHFNRIAAAATFVKNELIKREIDVPEYNILSISGRNEPVINIMPLLVSMGANCQMLKESAAASGIIIETLPNMQMFDKQNTGWIFIINSWISFLNELHLKLNGG